MPHAEQLAVLRIDENAAQPPPAPPPFFAASKGATSSLNVFAFNGGYRPHGQRKYPGNAGERAILPGIADAAIAGPLPDAAGTTSREAIRSGLQL